MIDRIGIVSNGYAHGTGLVDIETGERLKEFERYITAITWSVRVGGQAEATVQLGQHARLELSFCSMSGYAGLNADEIRAHAAKLNALADRVEEDARRRR